MKFKISKVRLDENSVVYRLYRKSGIFRKDELLGIYFDKHRAEEAMSRFVEYPYLEDVYLYNDKGSEIVEYF